VAATRLRVVTWNIRAAIGPGPFPDRWWDRIDADRLRAIGAFIAGLEADVVALQEVAVLTRDGEPVDGAGDLARQLGMELRYGAVRTFELSDGGPALGAGTFGNALLTRSPMRGSRTIALPMAPVEALVEPVGADHPAAGIRYADAPPTIREPRCLLLADLEGWRIATAHLSHIGSGERLLQARACVEALGSRSPALLAGDLNAAIDSPELTPFSAWTDGFDGPAGSPERHSTDDGMPIDHVLVRGASVQACRVVRESGELSDHYPVVAEVATSFDARGPGG
jgi:endonuclease/exonuclease/phosphatase family metal-dependent hydrolase